MTDLEGDVLMLEYDARVEIAAVDVLPWWTNSPVAAHMTAEGIN